jgi:hypothetical protein
MDDLTAKLLNEYIVLMSVAAWFVVWVVQRVFPVINTNYWAKQLKPLYPALLCQGFVWIPGAVEDGTMWGSRVLVALWCGFLASIGYQLVKRLASTRGVELPDDPAQLVQNGGTKPEEKPEEKPEDGDPAESDEPTPTETPAAKRSATPLPVPAEPKPDK